MAFTWSDFLPVARTLRATGDEASLRAAVSRAYYSVFGEAACFWDWVVGRDFNAGGGSQPICGNVVGVVPVDANRPLDGHS